MTTPRASFSSLQSLVAYATSRQEGNSKVWFHPDTMKWYGTKLGDGPYVGPDGRSYFTTRDARGFRKEDGKAWSVRVYDPVSNDVDTINFIGYGSKSAARGAAKFLAGRKVSERERKAIKPQDIEKAQTSHQGV